MFARVVALADDQTTLLILGDEKAAIVVPGDAIDFAFGLQCTLRKKMHMENRQKE